jgi:hypothetical protein
MPARAALVERAAQQARLARTPRRCLAVLAGLAVTPAWRARERRVRSARLEHRLRAAALRAVLAALVARAVMQELAALVAVVLLGRAAAVAWV